MNDAAAKARAVVREHLGLTHSRFDGLPLTPKEEQLVSAIAAAITEARKDRDMEWWQAVCLASSMESFRASACSYPVMWSYITSHP